MQQYINPPPHNSINPHHIVNTINASWGMSVIEWVYDQNCYNVSDRFIALFKNILPPLARARRPYFMVSISDSSVETKLLMNFKSSDTLGDYDHMNTIPFTIQYQNGNEWINILLFSRLPLSVE